MDLVFRRPYRACRRNRVTRSLLILFAVLISVGTWSRLHAQTAIEMSAETRAATRYEFSAADAVLLDEIQRSCFAYFWNEIGRPGMLAKDKTSDSVSSIAAIGFQLSSLPIGVERGWITRAQGEQRAIAVLRTLVGRTDNKKFGVYLHYLDSETGGPPDFDKTKHRYELLASTIDHALFEAGCMTAASYFGGEVAQIAKTIIVNTNWRAMYDESAEYLTMGWQAATDLATQGPGKLSRKRWEWCSDEERLIYFLAVGSPNAQGALEPAAYYHLKRVVKQHENGPPFVVSWNGSLFTYFFASCWIDYRSFAVDDPAAFGEDGPGVQWFENSRRAVLTHRDRCQEAASRYKTLGEDRWGLAPCAFRNDYLVHEVQPNITNRDVWFGGVTAPYAAGAAIMFAPRESLAALREYRTLQDDKSRPVAWHDPADGGYGFVDSFSLDPPRGQLETLGIDAGPLLLAIENARTGLVWQLFMKHDVAQRAVERLQWKSRVVRTASLAARETR
jgi:hypothetical protein